MTIYIYNVNFNNLTADKIILMFIIPIIDTIRLMIQRAISGRSPLSSDRNHFHHILSNIFKDHNSIVIYLSIVAIPSIFFFILAKFDCYMANISDPSIFFYSDNLLF